MIAAGRASRKCGPLWSPAPRNSSGFCTFWQDFLMNSAPSEETMIVTLRVCDLRQIVHDAVAAALTLKGRTDLLDLKQVFDRYRVGRGALLAAARRGEVELSHGPRRKLLIRAGEVERWLTQNRYRPPNRSLSADLEEWDREVTRSLERDIAEGRLRVMSPQELAEARSRRRPRKPT